MKINPIPSNTFKGMIAGKTTTGASVAIETHNIDKLESTDGKTTQCSNFAPETKTFQPIITFNAPIEAVLKAYSSVDKYENKIAQI